MLIERLHNIIQIHNNVLWDWQYYAKYSTYSYWMWELFCMTLSDPRKIVMNMNNAMCHKVSMLAHNEHFRFRVKVWPFDRVGKCPMPLAIVNHIDCHFKLKKCNQDAKFTRDQIKYYSKNKYNWSYSSFLGVLTVELEIFNKSWAQSPISL